jgi:hypothetical protein
MAIVSGDLKFYLSGGGTNNNPDLSLGGVISSVQAGTNLFDNINSTESAAGDTEYRALFVKNTNATDTAFGAKVWIFANTPSTYTAVQIAVADEGVANTIETITNESTAPSGPTFANAEDEANALTLDDLEPGEAFGIWIKRTVTAGAPAFANDTQANATCLACHLA